MSSAYKLTKFIDARLLQHIIDPSCFQRDHCELLGLFAPGCLSQHLKYLKVRLALNQVEGWHESPDSVDRDAALLIGLDVLTAFLVSVTAILQIAKRVHLLQGLEDPKRHFLWLHV